MSGSIDDLRKALAAGLHTDNLDYVIGLCDALTTGGDERLPLFVLAACLRRIRLLKQEVPGRASVVEQPDREVSEAADKLLEAVVRGLGRDALWTRADDLVARTLSLPPDYPSG